MSQPDLRPRPAAAMSIPGILLRDRSMVALCALSLCLGIAYAISVFPLWLVLGNGPFWQFPRGTISGAGSGSADDIADALVGYLYLMHAPWGLPILFAPNLAAPAGTNVFWLDAIPWLSLLGKTLFWLTGEPLNLLGIFVLLCFALPGVAMTALLGICGHRNIAAALAGTVLAEAAPFLWFGWGHLALSAQFMTILALCLYCLAIRRRGDGRVSFGWLTLLTFALLTNIYLLTMAFGIWAASYAQRTLAPRAPARLLLVRAAWHRRRHCSCVMLITGILTSNLRIGRNLGIRRAVDEPRVAGRPANERHRPGTSALPRRHRPAARGLRLSRARRAAGIARLHCRHRWSGCAAAPAATPPASRCLRHSFCSPYRTESISAAICC